MSRILLVNTTLGFNAPGRLVETLAEGARAAGHDVRVAYSRGDSMRLPSPTLWHVGGRADILSHVLLTRITDMHARGSRRATVDLVSKMLAWKPDVVHVHNLHGYWLDAPLFMAAVRRLGCRVVWTLHDMWPVTGHCAFPDVAHCHRYRTGCHDCPQMHQYPRSWVIDNSERNFRLKQEMCAGLSSLTLVVVSPWQRGCLRHTFLGAYPCRVIPNPIDPAFAPVCECDPMVVAAAASVWDHRKGLDRLRQLRELLPAEVDMRVAGLTRRQALTLRGITAVPRIATVGAMARFYSSATVFVNPSRGETLGMVNLEARACGTPVVSMDSGGLVSTVTAESGVAVPNGDVYSLALAVKAAMEPGRYDRAAIAAALRREYDNDKIVGRYMELY